MASAVAKTLAKGNTNAQNVKDSIITNFKNNLHHQGFFVLKKKKSKLFKNTYLHVSSTDEFLEATN